MSGNDVSGFLTLRRRIWATCYLELKEPLHLGAGKDPTSPIDLKIMRDSAGRPVIPGSSLKGFFRSHLGRILTGYKRVNGNQLRLGNMSVSLTPCVDSLINNQEGEGPATRDELCLLDKLFGYAGKHISVSSVIKFTDAVLSNPGEEDSMVRTHVSIDRTKDAAARGMLVNVEAARERMNGSPTRFRFTMVFDELADPLYEDVNKIFFYLILKRLRGEIEDFIGGWKSRGYGLVRIGLEDLEVAEIQDLIEGRRERVPLDRINSLLGGGASQ